MMRYTAIKDSQKHNYITSGFYWADVVYKKTYFNSLYGLFIFCRIDCKCSNKKIRWIIISGTWKSDAMRRKRTEM